MVIFSLPLSRTIVPHNSDISDWYNLNNSKNKSLNDGNSIYIENDAQNILDDCLAKSKDLIAHIQLLNNIVYS